MQVRRQSAHRCNDQCARLRQKNTLERNGKTSANGTKMLTDATTDKTRPNAMLTRAQKWQSCALSVQKQQHR